MVEFSRSTTLKIEVWRSRWSEEDLARLAHLLKQQAGVLTISLVTSDGEDHLRTNDPEFFHSSELPRALRSVVMKIDKGDVDCELKIALPDLERELGSSDPAKAEVSGKTRAAVTTLFRDLEKEFNARKLRGGRFVRFMHGLGGLIVTFVAASTVLLGLYAMLVGYAGEQIPWMTSTRVGTTLLIVGAGLALALAVPLTGRGLKAVARALPAVEFSGRLSPSNQFRRAGLLWVIGFVLLPLIVNLVSGLLLLWWD